MKWLLCVLVAVGSVLAADNGVAVSRYRDQDLIPIKTKLRFTTLIELPVGEEISEVSCGDTSYWVIDGRDNIVHVKPAREGAVTNLNVVLKSRAVYSFFLEEIGSKGSPDLKVVIGDNEVIKLRKEKAAQERSIHELNEAHNQELAQLEGARRLDQNTYKQEVARLESEIPARLTSFLTKQKFNYACYAKTSICLAAVFSTDAATYVVGRLGSSHGFLARTRRGVSGQYFLRA